ncbi:MAG: endonuclease/exonuclease/phosphatase family protein [Gemmatimonadales bacterium]
MSDVLLHTRPAEGTDLPLSGWRHNVGKPVSLDLAENGSRPQRSLVVLSWNVWIGRGDIVRVVTRIRQGEYAELGIPGDLPFVALLQEAYRAGDTVPPESNSFHARGFSLRALHREHEIRAVAGALELNLRYAPSMRNGMHQSDRGNAVLSDLPFVGAFAQELPFVLQRRVAVGATIRLGERLVHVHSAHFDPRGGSARDLLGIVGRERQASALLDGMKSDTDATRVLGADLNLVRQRREPAFRALMEAGFVTGIPDPSLRWKHTFHRPPRLILDWLMVRDRAGAVGGMQAIRLDENPQDRGPYVFGSDHHPLLCRIDFHP